MLKPGLYEQVINKITTIPLAAALIRNEGKILICQRGAGGSTAFLWEFPGGQLELGETLEECLIRECSGCFFISKVISVFETKQSNIYCIKQM